jgi:hypothetical protein
MDRSTVYVVKTEIMQMSYTVVRTEIGISLTYQQYQEPYSCVQHLGFGSQKRAGEGGMYAQCEKEDL